MNDIVIRGKVTIRQGDKVLVKDALNHFVDGGLSGLISQIITGGMLNGGAHWLWNYNTDGFRMYLGSNTTTATTTSMTALTTSIGTTPGTAPSSRSTESKDGSGDGIWRAIYHATWNAGTVSGTLGELALYLYPNDEQTAFGWNGQVAPDLEMVSRLASADTDFSSFTIDDTKPLTVDWTVEFAFS